MRILITGATGFIGAYLCNVLSRQYNVIGTTRSNVSTSTLPFKIVQVTDINKNTDWSEVLSGVDIVIHTVARVHQMHETSGNLLQIYREANTYATENLVEQARGAGVKQFIFLSSIKVNGEQTDKKAFDEADMPNPLDPYGISKLEAEQIIEQICSNSAMAYTIFRLPLVYGEGVKANFANLLALAKKGYPLPLAGINNKRSLLYLGNLGDITQKCLLNQVSYNEVFCLSDNDDVSTSELLQAIIQAYGSKTKLFSIPNPLFYLIGKLTGRSSFIKRLFGSLQVNSDKLCKTLGWYPPYTVRSALTEMAGKEKK